MSTGGNADVEVRIMDNYLLQLLMTDALGAQRQDHNVARQGVMNHQVTCHLMDNVFIRDTTEMSIPESMAVQSMIPREAQFANLADRTPVVKSGTT